MTGSGPGIRRTRSATALALLLTLALTLPAAAQTGAVLDSVRAFCQTELERQPMPGFSIAVAVDDQLVWSEGFGVAHVESGDLATGSTVYRIGSVSKPVVGTALMQLWEQGTVDLDEDIRTYIPSWPRKEKGTITVRNLLTHTSGIRHYRGGEFLSMIRYDDLEGPMGIFKDDPLLFEPGTQYSYSTYGFNLVANIVENTGGMPIEEYMTRHIYEPAWMNSTGMEDPLEIQRGRAGWYERDSRENLVNAPYVDLSNKYAGGGITSTVEDLCRLHIAYARGKLLEPATIDSMYTNQRLKDGSLGGYGLSWRVREVELADGRMVRQVSHSGGSVGANTLFIRYPDQGFAVAVVANHRAGLGRIVEGVTRYFHRAGAFETNR
ncbi:MAG: serine hydrolase domain-containing protein [bacterium]